MNGIDGEKEHRQRGNVTPGSGKRRATLRDVARDADVSVATVSRVLNAPASVSDATRLRVEATIAALRYVPSAAARAMNSGRSGLVAALLPTLDHAIYARVVDGLEDALSRHGLSLVVAQTRDDPEVTLARAQSLINLGAEGFILTGLAHGEAFSALLQHAGIPAVATSYHDPGSTIPTVGYDNAEAARLAAKHLTDLGHRRIAVVHGPSAHNDRIQRRIAAISALKAVSAFTFHEVELSMAGGAMAVDAILKGQGGATGILCFSDVLAMGALNRLQARGVQVPEAVSVIGIENLPGATVTAPTLSSVRLRIREMGARAADALAGWLETGTRPRHESLAVELVIRNSTGPAPQHHRRS